MIEGFAQSTIDAAIWLMCHQPADLPAFLREHPPGKVLERIAKEQIQAKRRRRAEAASA